MEADVKEEQIMTKHQNQINKVEDTTVEVIEKKGFFTRVKESVKAGKDAWVASKPDANAIEPVEVKKTSIVKSALKVGAIGAAAVGGLILLSKASDKEPIEGDYTEEYEGVNNDTYDDGYQDVQCDNVEQTDCEALNER